MTAPLAIITGASSGIGRATAEAFTARGWRTILIARRREMLDSLAADLRARTGGRIESLAYPLDLGDEAATARAISELLGRVGPPDVLVNNAGANDLVTFAAMPLADHVRIFRLNYHAPAQIIHALLPAMASGKPAEPGATPSQPGKPRHIINICSMSTKHGAWGHSSYAAAKAALVTLTATLATEHPPSVLRFSYVNPGIVRTPYFENPTYAPLWQRQKNRAIEPRQVARAVMKLIDRPRLEVCVPAHYRLIDWISAASPSWAHAIVARSSRPRANG